VAAQAHDDGFHEIQLNGKQLVFLFMAVTVVSVVIFLLGVMIGRGVRAERVAGDQTIAAAADAPSPQPAAPPPAAPAGADPTKAAPPAAVEDLTYFDRLQKSSAASEDLKAPAAAPKSDAKADHVETPAPAKPAPAAKSAATPAPSDKGYAVQVAAVKVRSQADAIASRLSSKGYAAYVQTPASGAPQVFRVRVGKFPTRRDAEAMAARLQKEEQFKPWVTR